MKISPRHKYTANVRDAVQWYMLKNEDFVSSVSFELRSENNEIVSFNGQSITFRLSIKEV